MRSTWEYCSCRGSSDVAMIGPSAEKFEDEMTLDLSIYRNLTHITRRGQRDIHERLREIGAMLKKWSASGGSGLLALNPEDVRQRDEGRLARLREQEEKPATGGD